VVEAVAATANSSTLVECAGVIVRTPVHSICELGLHEPGFLLLVMCRPPARWRLCVLL
jgi:hypothetical protein